MPLDLITGFPGFIGRRLVKQLLDAHEGTRVVALVEQRMLGPAREAAASIGADRIEVLQGDIADRRLGLSDEDYERLSSEATRVFHLAAIYDLAVPIELAQRVNVDGTGNVLELCARCEKLERLAYVSTAYVAGLRRGVVYEHELVMGQGFKNHYESTKFQAEVWVRRYLDRVPTTILRPAIVVGDSSTGETQKFDGPYYLLKAISLAERTGQPLMQFGRSDSPFNVVPVDYVVEAIARAAGLPETQGETLHLVDPEPLSAGDLLRLLAERYGARAPMGRIPPVLAAAALRLPPVQARFGGTPRESIAYLNHPVVFDMRRAVDLLAAKGLTPPRFADYAERLVGFFKEHENDPAFAPR
ncbi:MAG: SDR family oxidoreductase [Actinomycetota bacterium]|nr:SDR family oxidoreductase [Actinomycetota bacterium]